MILLNIFNVSIRIDQGRVDALKDRRDQRDHRQALIPNEWSVFSNKKEVVVKPS